MKLQAKSILFTFIVAMSSNLLIAQPGNNFAEQWYRAKYGRPLPAEQARIDAAQKHEASRSESAAVLGAYHAKAWSEVFFEAKYGRPTPRKEASLREANLGRDALMTSKLAPADDRFENWFRAKSGRAIR